MIVFRAMSPEGRALQEYKDGKGNLHTVLLFFPFEKVSSVLSVLMSQEIHPALRYL